MGHERGDGRDGAVKTKMAGRKQGNPENGERGDVGVISQTKPKLQKPSMYRVLLLNDDYTPMEFVVYVLEEIFNKSREDATQIMLHVHQNGVGLCGVFTYEVAETKVARVVEASRRNQHPLQCTMEKD
jgi:ATP-dependent Clp protease adaptor protein ClpS